MGANQIVLETGKFSLDITGGGGVSESGNLKKHALPEYYSRGRGVAKPVLDNFQIKLDSTGTYK